MLRSDKRIFRMFLNRLFSFECSDRHSYLKNPSLFLLPPECSDLKRGVSSTLLFRSSAQKNVIFHSTSDSLVTEHEFFSASIQLYRLTSSHQNQIRFRLVRIKFVRTTLIRTSERDSSKSDSSKSDSETESFLKWESCHETESTRLRESFFLEGLRHINLDRVIARYYTSLFYRSSSTVS